MTNSNLQVGDLNNNRGSALAKNLPKWVAKAEFGLGINLQPEGWS